ncbi:uncharacterized protein PGTG_03227 [Puccinia graminis f. sp. tritici CRL 75-36-700-3]|uniref:Uncharacterized protein n=1 Tax=Puccinia graminis f. sp. tritici (strain CRL 75-36-700-3 / race SCCL) TaxID=418459 RepID=E3JYZ6_PUCGT|nr:uncharacterized protein PGTG_03227 [Puccinia graminis f. sp. tritici CRL 75-36-700-3]EFP77271.1 hypothetical protein PGTG_03227 [Puccinia graminis f. sp. tritici CRL 75-36-700-3]
MVWTSPRTWKADEREKFKGLSPEHFIHSLYSSSRLLYQSTYQNTFPNLYHQTQILYKENFEHLPPTQFLHSILSLDSFFAPNLSPTVTPPFQEHGKQMSARSLKVFPQNTLYIHFIPHLAFSINQLIRTHSPNLYHQTQILYKEIFEHLPPTQFLHSILSLDSFFAPNLSPTVTPPLKLPP